MKKNLYITGNTKIRRDGNTLRIVTDDDSFTLPPSVIANLYLFGKCELSNGARNLLRGRSWISST